MNIIGGIHPSKKINLEFSIEVLKNFKMLPPNSQTSIEIPFTLPTYSKGEEYKIFEYTNNNHNSLPINHNVKSLEKAIAQYRSLNLGELLPEEHLLGIYTKHTTNGWTSTPIIGIEDIYLPNQLVIERIYDWSKELTEVTKSNTR